MNRRSFLLSASGAAAHPLLTSAFPVKSSLLYAAQQSPSKVAADHSLTIKPCTIEISPGVNIKTVAYNGLIPGPLLRLRQGVPVTIDVTNECPSEEIVHWHGLTTDSFNDGAMEEGSPMIPPGATLRYNLKPDPAGTRWYHTHVMAGENIEIGPYTGQYGFLIVDGHKHPGHYDHEVFLAIHYWAPELLLMKNVVQAPNPKHPPMRGWHVQYKYATMNQHRLGAGEPLRVKHGQRVLLRLLNANASENIEIALPGHTFKVVAMDGNSVPNQKEVEVLSIAVGERVDAIVEMKSPGVWIFGSTDEDERQMGLGIVIEYAGKSGKPVWVDPKPVPWDYTQFASNAPAQAPAETIVLSMKNVGRRKDAKFATWAMNGMAWPDIEYMKVKYGKRYRLVFKNDSDTDHSMHLHRHTFEVVTIGDRQIKGLMKDCVNTAPFQTVTIDFVADNPGDTLLHCHMAQHAD
jgi:FtsP/CotA-like multicopper oxidase with cupredoxin domain